MPLGRMPKPDLGTGMRPGWVAGDDLIRDLTLREPVGTVSVAGAPNSPPPEASQIDTETVSPIPIFGSGGRPYF